jgi:endonuclease I
MHIYFLNFKTLKTITLFLLISLPIWGEIPTNYYSTLEGKISAELKTAAYNTIKTHISLKYSNMWNYFPQTDYLPSDPTEIWDVYSNNVVYFSAHSSIDIEHSVPNSWWGGPKVDNEYAYGDLMNLYPANNSINRSKGNNPLSEVGVTTMDNGVSKSGTSITSGYSGKGFEPADEYKGDFARTYFYMATCYQDYTWLTDATGEYEITNGGYPSFQPWAIPLLLKWHRQDPVSKKEIDRNETVFKLQQNRNPFIDYPQLAEFIWGNMKDSTWSSFKVTTDLSSINNSELTIYPNPAKNFINIKFVGDKRCLHYSIYSSSGCVVITGDTSENSINISILKSGIYWCVLETNTEKWNKKLVVLK